MLIIDGVVADERHVGAEELTTRATHVAGCRDEQQPRAAHVADGVRAGSKTIPYRFSSRGFVLSHKTLQTSRFAGQAADLLDRALFELPRFGRGENRQRHEYCE